MSKPTTDIDALVRKAVFGTEDEKAHARWQIWEMGQQAGVRPASIHELYLARGRGEVQPFTTPAMNVRIMSYDTGRAIFRAAKKLDAGAIICEIARSEIAYTDQRPAEYVAVMTAAALREGFVGPLFIQGDHVQVNAKKYAADPDTELKALRSLIEEELHAGFYNIDVDTSTLVDLSKPNLDEQQRTNYERAAELTKFIREQEPDGVTVSVGAEIGEVGGKNSDVHELKAFMDGYNRTLKKMGVGAGISKISVQTGTSHGGVVLPDGSIAKVQLDLEALKALSRDARAKYGLGGAVQHGASTLPAEAFSQFPQCEAIEIHLATNFQTIVMDHPALPKDLRREVNEWVKTEAKEEWKKGDSEEQFLYKSRKKAIGPFKKQFWNLPEDVRARIGADLEKTFTFLFEQLRVKGTRAVTDKYVKPKLDSHAAPRAALVSAPDDAEAGE
ncbi:MAG TPA: class II fructose-bisphosphate aldolase [Gemmatimonadales bacterium]|jgi:fructose/tagatose bisphosphate aldolase|nr:class II fructose-bisphosphate aldolase [Gemmatimonadales bacterium]